MGKNLPVLRCRNRIRMDHWPRSPQQLQKSNQEVRACPSGRPHVTLSLSKGSRRAHYSILTTQYSILNTQYALLNTIMQLPNIIHNWLLGGTDPEVGCRLFLDYCQPSHAIARIISKAPERHIQTIRIALLNKAGLPYNTHLASRRPEECHPEPVEGQVEGQVEGRSLRHSKGRTPKVRTD